MRRPFLHNALLLLTGLCGPAWLPLNAQTRAVPEYMMKASYLYNFMVFAEWPASTDGPSPPEGLLLCVLGQDNFGQALNDLEGKTVNGRRLSVSRLNGLTHVRKCQLLFVTEQEAPNMQAILKHLADAPVLTVADTPVAAGAAILLSLDGKRLIFDVNMQRTKKVGITLSSKVLQLARSTH